MNRTSTRQRERFSGWISVLRFEDRGSQGFVGLLGL